MLIDKISTYLKTLITFNGVASIFIRANFVNLAARHFWLIPQNFRLDSFARSNSSTIVFQAAQAVNFNSFYIFRASTAWVVFCQLSLHWFKPAFWNKVDSTNFELSVWDRVIFPSLNNIYDVCLHPPSTMISLKLHHEQNL